MPSSVFTRPYTMGVSFGNAIGIVSSTAANPTVPISLFAFFLFFFYVLFFYYHLFTQTLTRRVVVAAARMLL